MTLLLCVLITILCWVH